MSHAAIHLSFGMLVATLLTLPRIWRAWRADRPLAAPVAAWLVSSYALGFYALIPSALGRLGLSPHITQGVYMNLFLFHPLIRQCSPGGKIVGAAIVGALFFTQYLLLLLLLRFRIKHPKKTIS